MEERWVLERARGEGEEDKGSIDFLGGGGRDRGGGSGGGGGGAEEE